MEFEKRIRKIFFFRICRIMDKLTIYSLPLCLNLISFEFTSTSSRYSAYSLLARPTYCEYKFKDSRPRKLFNNSQHRNFHVVFPRVPQWCLLLLHHQPHHLQCGAFVFSHFAQVQTPWVSFVPNSPSFHVLPLEFAWNSARNGEYELEITGINVVLMIYKLDFNRRSKVHVNIERIINLAVQTPGIIFE